MTIPVLPSHWHLRHSHWRPGAALPALGLLLLSSLTLALPQPAQAGGPEDWATVADHAIEAVSDGWSLPTDIRFVPDPGPNPGDPLYYVSELRGAIKVVTRDGTVHEYEADVTGYRPPVELPQTKAEVGLGGICLDPAEHALFATTIIWKGAAFYNRIVRFDHAGGRFALKPSKRTVFEAPFGDWTSAVSHQIGKCEIGPDGLLYVGVGDAEEPQRAQGLDNPSGKVLRMRTDGSAPPENPFYNAAAPHQPASYVYVYGLRNPFPITLSPEGQLYILDNGPDQDRLIEARPGKNYLWNGNKISTGADGIWNWRSGVGPAGAVYLPLDNPLFPAWRGSVIGALGGNPLDPGPSKNGRITLAHIPVQPGRGLRGLPETIVSFKAKRNQILVPVALGPDGLYFAGMLPDENGKTWLFRVVRQEGAKGTAARLDGGALFTAKGCDACHAVGGKGGDKGPALDGLVDRLLPRLNDRSYEALVATLDLQANPVLQAFKDERAEVLALEGEARVRRWVELRLQQPNFDMPDSQMPALGLNPQEIDTLVTWLMTLRNPQESRWSWAEEKHRAFRVWWDSDPNARPTVAFILGILLTLGTLPLLRRLRRLAGRLLRRG